MVLANGHANGVVPQQNKEVSACRLLQVARAPGFATGFRTAVSLLLASACMALHAFRN